MTYRPGLADFVATRVGSPTWVVAARATAALRARYPVVISPRAFKALQLEFNAQ